MNTKTLSEAVEEATVTLPAVQAVWDALFGVNSNPPEPATAQLPKRKPAEQEAVEALGHHFDFDLGDTSGPSGMPRIPEYQIPKIEQLDFERFVRKEMKPDELGHGWTNQRHWKSVMKIGVFLDVYTITGTGVVTTPRGWTSIDVDGYFIGKALPPPLVGDTFEFETSDLGENADAVEIGELGRMAEIVREAKVEWPLPSRTCLRALREVAATEDDEARREGWRHPLELTIWQAHPFGHRSKVVRLGVYQAAKASLERAVKKIRRGSGR